MAAESARAIVICTTSREIRSASRLPWLQATRTHLLHPDHSHRPTVACAHTLPLAEPLITS